MTNKWDVAWTNTVTLKTINQTAIGDNPREFALAYLLYIISTPLNAVIEMVSMVLKSGKYGGGWMANWGMLQARR